MSKTKRKKQVYTVPSAWEWENPNETPVKNRLFVYGIFLNESNRIAYGMSNPQYATVPDYATFGQHIVQAVHIEGAGQLALTGLTVDVDPTRWDDIDRLEGGYDRTLVTTDNSESVYMYTAKKGREF